MRCSSTLRLGWARSTGVRRLASRDQWTERVKDLVAADKAVATRHADEHAARIYRHKDYTPVEEAFPTLGQSKWVNSDAAVDALLPPPESQPEKPFNLRVAILGPPNSGKSSLMNALVTSRVSAVSGMPGTTSTWVRGVTTVHDTQIVFYDTPGIVLPAFATNKRRAVPYAFLRTDAFKPSQVKSGGGPPALWTRLAWESLMEVDVCVLCHAVGLGFLEKEHVELFQEVSTRCTSRRIPLILALTKCDKLAVDKQRSGAGRRASSANDSSNMATLKKEMYFALRGAIESIKPFSPTAVFETSVRTFQGVIPLKDHLARHASPGPWEFFRTQSTDLLPPEVATQIADEVFCCLLPGKIALSCVKKIVGWTVRTFPDGRPSQLSIHIEVFFERPTNMYTFFTHRRAIHESLQLKLTRQFKRDVRVSFQEFITPRPFARPV